MPWNAMFFLVYRKPVKSLKATISQIITPTFDFEPNKQPTKLLILQPSGFYYA